MDAVAFVDGAIVPLPDARLALDDRAALLGDGVFETLRIRHGHAVRLEAHRQRLQRGADALGIDGALPAFDAACKALLGAAGTAPCTMRISISTGRMAGIAGGGTARATGFLRPAIAEGGDVTLVTVPIRLQSNPPWAGCKTLSMLPYVQARRLARAQGADDAVLRNDAGNVAEASTSNILAMIDGALHAPGPSSGAVDGVTRAATLDLAADDGVPIDVSLSPEGLARADAVALSNTTQLLRIATRIDGRPLPGAGPFEDWQRRLLQQDSP